MTIRLIDKGWRKELNAAAKADNREVLIVCPFIQLSVIETLLKPQPRNVKVITRFNLVDFASGVSDVAALRSITVAHAVKVPESVSCNDTAWHGPGGAVSSLTIGWSA